jgi:hypothetical protein
MKVELVATWRRHGHGPLGPARNAAVLAVGRGQKAKRSVEVAAGDGDVGLVGRDSQLIFMHGARRAHCCMISSESNGS